MTCFLARFIRNHYQEAMTTIRELSSELAILKTTLDLSDDDFPRFVAEERAYLSSLKQPPARDVLQIRYVQVLGDLEEKKLVILLLVFKSRLLTIIFRAAWSTARETANSALTGVIQGDFNAIAAAINQVRIRVELAYTQLQNTEALAAHIQGQLGLESPWKVGDEEYNRYKEEATFGKYREVLGELERLVVMRLFELSKLSMSGTGTR